MAYDITAEEGKEFELLPEDKWVLGRLLKRNVVKWVAADSKYVDSNDELVTKARIALAAAEASGDDVRIREMVNEVKAFQFRFVFRPLESKKSAGYTLMGRTPTRLIFENAGGAPNPNKLAQFYLGAGGVRVKTGERLDLDSIIGNYVAMKLQNEKSANNGRIYQQVVALRPLTNEELLRAKGIEIEVKEIEKALAEEKKKILQQTLDNLDVTQTPIMEAEQNNAAGAGEESF